MNMKKEEHLTSAPLPTIWQEVAKLEVNGKMIILEKEMQNNKLLQYSLTTSERLPISRENLQKLLILLTNELL